MCLDKDILVKGNKIYSPNTCIFAPENINNLLQLIKENPGIEIKPMVDSEVIADDCFSYWCGSWGKAKLDEYWVSDERIYFKENDFEDAFVKLAFLEPTPFTQLAAGSQA